MPQLDLATYQSQAIYLCIIFIASYVLLELFLIKPLARLIKLRLYIIQECNIPTLKFYYNTSFVSLFFSLVFKLTTILETITYYNTNIFNLSSFLNYSLTNTSNSSKSNLKSSINKTHSSVIPELAPILVVSHNTNFGVNINESYSSNTSSTEDFVEKLEVEKKKKKYYKKKENRKKSKKK